MILKAHCPYCKEKRDVTREEKNTLFRDRTFTCGHMERINFTQPEEFATILSKDSKSPRPFQLDGAAFAVNSGYRCLIADECGLGKTVQAQMILTRPDTLNGLIVCKAGLLMQWLKETLRWKGVMAQIIGSESDPSLGFQVVIVSMDLLRRFKEPALFIEKFGIKTIILDECQAIKNHDSQRTNAVRKLAQHVPYFIALSGTPIKNHAGEYFPILNILRPDLFPTLSGFYNNWTDSYWNGYGMKTAGLRQPQKFQEYTKDFIIRRTKAEVLPQLPRVDRRTRFSDLGKEVEKAYLATLNEFTDYYNSGKDSGNALARSANILSFLTKMRHLTGVSKVDPTVSYVEEFLMESETNKKIVIFLHHKDVALMLQTKLAELCSAWPSEYGAAPLTLKSEHSTPERQAIIDEFQSGKSRILIASTLAAGEGVDGIQNVCSDIIILERQWNPANEEQVEGRIERMGQQSASLTSTYMIATGTVDEFFAEIVERKRSYVANTLDGVDIKWDESSIMKELAETLASQGSKKWSW